MSQIFLKIQTQQPASVAIALWNNETETKDQEDRGIFRENMV